MELNAILHEKRVAFPVAIDQPRMPENRIPVTMQRYRMQGTPTLQLIDRHGILRRQIFGHVPDLQLGEFGNLGI